jgi:type II secretory pathway component PulK
MKQEKGIALLLVLWIITLLTVICAEFSWTMRTETVITRNFKEGEQAAYVAEAGINKAIIELMRGINTPRTSVKKPETEEPEEPAPDLWLPGIDLIPFTFNDFTCEISIEDENNKININAFLAEAKKNPVKLKSLLEEKIGLEGEERDVVADSMIDWWDTDRDITGVNGAERDYYLSLDDPYECRDEQLPVIEDLLLVKGIDENIFYGDKKSAENATTLTKNDLETILTEGSQPREALQEPEPEADDSEAALEMGTRNLGLVNIFTTYSSAREFKIDMNSASVNQLLLLEGMDSGTAQAIIEERKIRLFASPTDRLPQFKNYAVWKKDIITGTGTQAHYYTITSRGFVGAVTREISCTVLITKNNFFLMRWQEGR